MKIEIAITGIFKGGITRLNIAENISSSITIAQLLKKLDKEGKPEKNFFKELLRKRTSLVIMLNGVRINIPNDLEKTLCDGDVISVLSPVAGG